jgi:hypothetical protein
MIYRCQFGSYQLPFAEYEIDNSIQIIMRIPKGLRPSLPPSIPQSLALLVRDCWDNEPSIRPSCEQLLERLSDCEKELDGKYVTLENTAIQIQ